MEALTSLQSLATVPLLEVDGGNWPIFRRKFETYMDSAGLDEHFIKSNYPTERYEDTEAKPEIKKEEDTGDFQKRVDAWKDGEVKWKEGVKTWKKEDAKARAALGKVLPNSVYMDMEGEWVVLNCRMPNSNSTDARDRILLPGVVDYNGLQICL